jgi:hypothetical protein
MYIYLHVDSSKGKFGKLKNETSFNEKITIIIKITKISSTSMTIKNKTENMDFTVTLLSRKSLPGLHERTATY